MEAEDDEEISDSNERSDESSEVWDCVGGGGGGDEGGGDEQLFQISRLQQHATSETSFNRWVIRILVIARLLKNSPSMSYLLHPSRFGKPLTLYTEKYKYWPYNWAYKTDIYTQTRSFLSAIVIFAWIRVRLRRTSCERSLINLLNA